MADIDRDDGPLVHERDPAILLRRARTLREARRQRAEVMGTHLFDASAWDLLIAGYIAEAEARRLDVEEIAAVLECPRPVAHRWARVMLDQRWFEIECDRDADRPAYRLTLKAHGQFERFIGARPIDGA